MLRFQNLIIIKYCIMKFWRTEEIDRISTLLVIQQAAF